MDAPAIFTARGLTKTYRMGEVEVPALRGIDLDLFTRELVVLLGPSGAANPPSSISWAGWIPPRAASSSTSGNL